MKNKKNISLLSLLVVIILIPQVTFASWWNPFSWFHKPIPIIQPVTIVQPVTPALIKDSKILSDQPVFQLKISQKENPALKVARCDTLRKINLESYTNTRSEKLTRDIASVAQTVEEKRKIAVQPFYDYITQAIQQTKTDNIQTYSQNIDTEMKVVQFDKNTIDGINGQYQELYNNSVAQINYLAKQDISNYSLSLDKQYINCLQ